MYICNDFALKCVLVIDNSAYTLEMCYTILYNSMMTYWGQMIVAGRKKKNKKQGKYIYTLYSTYTHMLMA